MLQSCNSRPSWEDGFPFYKGIPRFPKPVVFQKNCRSSTQSCCSWDTWWFSQETHLDVSPWCHDPMTEHQRLMSLERTVLWGQFCGFKRAFWRQKDSRLSRLCSPPRFKFLQWFQWLTCQMPSHRPFATFSRSFDDTLQVTVGLTGGYWEQLHSNRLCRRKGYGLVSSVIRLWVSTSEQSLYQYLI